LILLCIGLPGRFAEWCDRVIGRLAARMDGPVVTRSWPSLADMFGYENLPSTLDQIAWTSIETGAAHVVLGARQPDEGFYAALDELRTPFVLALDDPRMAAGDMISTSVAEPRAVTRAVANSCALVMRYADLPGALPLHADRVGSDLPATVAAIAEHFGISVSQADKQAIAAELGGIEPAEAAPSLRQWAAKLPESTRKMVEGALTGYAREFAGRGLDQIVWPRELFYLAADAARSPVEPLDAAGGSRILIYGPYIHLPRGSWTARIVLGFSPEAVGHAFTVDIFSAGVLAAATIQPEAAGIYSRDLSFSVDAAHGQGLEARVAVASANARGQVAFGHVVLQRVAARDALAVNATDSDFLAALKL
jgi:hypothetical protein